MGTRDGEVSGECSGGEGWVLAKDFEEVYDFTDMAGEGERCIGRGERLTSEGDGGGGGAYTKIKRIQREMSTGVGRERRRDCR